MAQNGELFVAYGYTFRPPGGFADGQPGGSFTIPEVAVVRLGSCGRDGDKDEKGDHERDDDCRGEDDDHGKKKMERLITLSIQGLSLSDKGDKIVKENPDIMQQPK